MWRCLSDERDKIRTHTTTRMMDLVRITLGVTKKEGTCVQAVQKKLNAGISMLLCRFPRQVSTSEQSFCGRHKLPKNDKFKTQTNRNDQFESFPNI